jgi:hypothetical protein
MKSFRLRPPVINLKILSGERGRSVLEKKWTRQSQPNRKRDFEWVFRQVSAASSDVNMQFNKNNHVCDFPVTLGNFVVNGRPV